MTGTPENPLDLPQGTPPVLLQAVERGVLTPEAVRLLMRRPQLAEMAAREISRSRKFQEAEGRQSLALRTHAATASLPPPDESAFAPILSELEAIRHAARHQIAERTARYAPKYIAIGFLIGLGLTIASHIAGKGDWALFGLPFLGGALGCFRARRGPEEDAWQQMYRQRVLSKLAASFGALQWRPAGSATETLLSEITACGLFARWNKADSQGEIHGRYHGVAISLLDIGLRMEAGDKSETIFRGALVTLTLPQNLHATIVVRRHRNIVADFVTKQRIELPALTLLSLDHVQLEDPVFVREFDVHASDQVMARVLLTPSFMERFRTLARRLGAPALLVQDDRLVVAVETGNVFKPPAFDQPATARDRLMELRNNIALLLDTADAVIDLDTASRLQKVLSTATAAGNGPRPQ
ncbi:MAG: DUF3137 domain-containing protein [Alphaproteobacteria bacterium]|nr:DUF3137 domain-containing protein [Alphaproteobacteria bacterium]